MSPILSSLSKQLERPEAEGLVEDLVDQPLALVAVQERVFGVAELLDDPSNVVAQRLGVDLGDAIHVEPVDQAHVDMALERLVLLLGRVDFLGGLASARRSGRWRGDGVVAGPASIPGSVSAALSTGGRWFGRPRRRIPAAEALSGANGLRPSPRNISVDSSFQWLCGPAAVRAHVKRRPRTGLCGASMMDLSAAGLNERAISRKTW